MVAKLRGKYTARATRSGRWWAIEVPELRGVFSQAKRLDQVGDMARDAIALFLDVPRDSFDITVDPVLSPDVRRIVAAAKAARTELVGMQADAAARSREAVQRLTDLGLPLRDIGEVLEISHQRAGQLVAASAQPRPGSVQHAQRERVPGA